jgi:uncharacterized protein HemX
MRAMAEARTSSRRIRLPKVKFPTRSKGAGSSSKKPAPATEPDTASKTAEKAAGGGKPAGTKAPATKTAAGAKAPDPNLVERMEGLQGWMAEIERKQGRMTYFGAAAILIAILAAGAALYFGITSKSDSATKDDLDALETKVDGLKQAVTKNNQATQQTLNSTITGLQNSIQALQKKQAEDAANISTLQSQASKGALKGAAATPGTTITPGTTTTTPTTPGKP